MIKYKLISFFMLSGMTAICPLANGFDDFENYTGVEALKKNYVVFDANNPFPELCSLTREDGNQFASFGAIKQTYAVFMREIKFPPGHRNSALKLKLRGCAGECDPITAIVTLRPEKVGDNIAEQRFLLPVNEWCEVKLDCPELLNFD